MARVSGKRQPLSLARRMVVDLLDLCRPIPFASGEKRLQLRELRDAMAACRPRVNPLIVFFKAYALVAAEQPALRRHLVSWPWPHLYEHPESVGALTISRPLDGDDALLYLPITAPEHRPIRELEAKLATARQVPLQQIPAFRRQLRIARLPKLLRRAFYRLIMGWSGDLRARYLGTFGMSVLASMGASTLTTLTPWTLMLHYTPFDDSGAMFVRWVFDHRVFDGFELVTAMHRLEKVLQGPILDEVRSLTRKTRAA